MPSYEQILKAANKQAKKNVKDSKCFYESLSKKDRMVFRTMLCSEMSYMFTLLNLKSLIKK